MALGILSKLVQLILSFSGFLSPRDGEMVCTNGVKLGGSINENYAIKQNAYWLNGNVLEDRDTLAKIRKMSCEELAVPVVVFSMMPTHGLEYHKELDYYIDKASKKSVRNWEDYDGRIDYIADWIAEIPSILILEPMLITRVLASSLGKTGKTWDYQIDFEARVDKIKAKFPNSWIYIDVGDLTESEKSSIDGVVEIMKRMPVGIRGVSLNVGSYQGTDATKSAGEYINCQTGLHYVIDTSRNGGSFSKRPENDIRNCPFDPPGVAAGEYPSWQEGSIPDQSISTRKKRWTFGEKVDTDDYDLEYLLNVTTVDYSYNYNYTNLEYVELNSTYPEYIGLNSTYGLEGFNYTDLFWPDLYPDLYTGPLCVGSGGGLDAFLWVKTLGYSDGRMFPAGSYHPCLVNHAVECSYSCPAFVRMTNGNFQRSLFCKC